MNYFHYFVIYAIIIKRKFEICIVDIIFKNFLNIMVIFLAEISI